MTKTERHIFTDWCSRIKDAGEKRDATFKEMQQLCESRGGRLTCSLEQNLKYLLTCEDERTRDKALRLYATHKAADAEYMLISQLAQAMAGA